MLQLLRPVIVVVDGWGRIGAVHGGFGGFLGHDLDNLVGTNVLDLVAECERDDVASHFVSHQDDVLHTSALPLPFRVKLLDATGGEHPVDVIPTGRPDDPDVNGWVVVLVPLSLQAGPSRSLDAELAGATRLEVKQRLAEELAVDNAERTSRLFVIDLPSGEVTGARSDEHGLVDVLRQAVRDGWEPWQSTARDNGCQVALDDAPPDLAAVLQHGGWNVIEAVPVVLDDELVAAFVRLSRVPTRPSLDASTTNVESRMRGLVEVTRLLYGRWRAQDELVTAATTDPLTGLSNRDALTEALAQRERSVAVLYIDIDHFKGVNDIWGHTIGDRVLVEVSRRISAACRRDDVVARVGGDEFVVLLRHVDEVIARRICRRIIDEVRLPLGLVEGPRHVSVSVGLALDPLAGDMVEQADQAILAAKRQGRARLVTA